MITISEFQLLSPISRIKFTSTNLILYHDQFNYDKKCKNRMISYIIYHLFPQKFHNTFQYYYLAFIIHILFIYGYTSKKYNYKKKKRNNYHFQVLINSFLNRLFLLSFLNFSWFNDGSTIFWSSEPIFRIYQLTDYHLILDCVFEGTF